MGIRDFNVLLFLLLLISLLMLPIVLAESPDVHPSTPTPIPDDTVWTGLLRAENADDAAYYSEAWFGVSENANCSGDFNYNFDKGASFNPPGTRWVMNWFWKSDAPGDGRLKLMELPWPADGLDYPYKVYSGGAPGDIRIVPDIENYVPRDYSVVLELDDQTGLIPAYIPENVNLKTGSYIFTCRDLMGVLIPRTGTLHIDKAVSLSVSPSHQEGSIGELLTYTVTVRNTGRYDDIYTFTASDDLAWDLTLSDNLLSIPAGGSVDVKLTVSVEGYATDSITVTAVGAYALGSNNVEAEGVASPLPGVSVSVSISPSENEVTPGSTAAFTVTVTNKGEVVDDYDLLVTDNTDLGVVLDDGELTVPAGESRQTTLGVTVPSDATGGESTEITVTATSQGYPMVEDSAKCLIMVQEGGEAPSPGFTWLPIAAVFIVLVVLIGVILVIHPF